MKHLFSLAILCCLGIAAQAQIQNPHYNKTLAYSLGADDYGMKSYMLVILKTGSNTTTDKEKLNEYFRGHIENIGRLAKEGKLIVAGPLGKNDKNYRGIFILDAKTVEEAQKLVETDPAVKAKIFDVELYPWYGSAALPVYLETHNKISKENP
ncbi:YciI family protein [Pontibacter anaerobius]|uniref:YciI family protein n=1 Tax=Pontibacter anaerobius TaxID=2993940 RepID=A0ABT3RBQ8_9BACT|nr:YciI family protein [Pontibacter anaerobius]MCX2738960.1 YciI family protein [Pontibacter anaerobius]